MTDIDISSELLIRKVQEQALRIVELELTLAALLEKLPKETEPPEPIA